MISTRLASRALVALSLWLAAPAIAQQPVAASQPDSAARPLEARVRERIAAMVQQRLALTDDQMRQLTAVNASYETKRRDLMARERESRVVIREEIRRGKDADEKRVQGALDELFRLQRERIDITEQEQRELSKFMQPSQRAGYLALQEQLRRRIEQLRRRGAGAAMGAEPRPRR